MATAGSRWDVVMSRNAGFSDQVVVEKVNSIKFNLWKAQYMKSDPDYLSCKKKECKRYQNGKCTATTCSGSIKFHVINIRRDIEFVFFSGGFLKPCIVGRSTPVGFANPKKPLFGHVSSTDSTGTSMRLTWVSGDKEPQQVQYGGGKTR
ncbi:Purple acid phosphatase-like, N-terminal [Sesbania bispinosa]|nr:Purple acid phosphatase-like, N-terminal [Sesbania bispinosa]